MEDLVIKLIFVTYVLVMSFFDAYSAKVHNKDSGVTFIIIGITYPIFVYYICSLMAIIKPDASTADFLMAIALLVLGPIGIYHGRKHNN